MSFISGFNQLREQAIVGCVKQAKGAASYLTDAIIDATPVLYGPLKGDWTVTTGSPAGKADRGSDAVGTATKARARTAINMLPNDKDWEFYFTNTKDYAFRIEFLGYSRKAPIGMVRPQLTRIAEFVSRAVGGGA